MKVITIPTELRIFISDSATQEQIEQITTDCMSGDFPIVESGDRKSLLKHVCEFVGAYTPNDKVVAEVDLWGGDSEGKVKVADYDASI